MHPPATSQAVPPGQSSPAADLRTRAREIAASTGSDVPSPCISVCRMHAATGLCEGCWRTLDEIAAWSRLGADAKRAVWRAIAGRAQEQQP